MKEKKGNQFRNQVKEQEVDEISSGEKVSSKKEFRNRDKENSVYKLESLKLFFRNEKLVKITGLTLLLSSFYLLIAFTSFFFTSEVDQGEGLTNPANILLNNDVKVENWLGKLGAVISEQFINDWFGVSSYLFALISFVVGFRLVFKQTLFSFNKLFGYTFFFLIWLSVSLSFAFNKNYLFLGGTFGYHSNLWMQGVLGYAGTGLLLVFSVLTFSVIAFNLNFHAKPKAESNADGQEDENEALVSINNLVTDEQKKNYLKEERLPDYRKETVNNKIEEILTAEEDAELFDLKVTTKPETKAPPVLELERQVNEVINSVSNVSTTTAPGDIEFEVEQVKESELIAEEDLVSPDSPSPFGDYDPTLDLSSYKFPIIDLLEKHGNDTIVVNNEELQENKNKILDTLANYNIQIEKIKATIGPTVTLYEIVPAAGVRISKIKNLEDDIALSLSALGIRIIAPIPGKGTIGIEVPNQNPEVVSMRSVIASEKFQHSPMELPIALGKTISNETFIADLAKMPHLLMAGATGQGKSVGLNAILVSLLYKKHPAQVKFVLVDPKKVELTLFNTIERHFLAKLPDSAEAIITDTKKVIHTLNSLCIEMDNRYELLKNAQVRNLKEYNAKFISRKLNPNEGHHFLPYIVLVVDEFADLIMTAGKEVEMPIARLAQLARAIGIHLIIATQRPSVNIITGTIKANFPARIAFRVTSKIDSRTILDSGGAEQLIGRGDMLLSTGNDLIRIQCAFVDTPEVDKITEFIGSQRGYPNAFLLPEYIDETGSSSGGESFNAADKDALFDEAARIIVQHQQGSASLLQRRLKLGYNRAGRIIDQLEAAGIIGPFEGSKAREVLIKDPMSLEQFLTNKEKI